MRWSAVGGGYGRRTRRIGPTSASREAVEQERKLREGGTDIESKDADMAGNPWMSLVPVDTGRDSRTAAAVERGISAAVAYWAWQGIAKVQRELGLEVVGRPHSHAHLVQEKRNDYRIPGVDRVGIGCTAVVGRIAFVAVPAVSGRCRLVGHRVSGHISRQLGTAYPASPLTSLYT